MNIKMISMENKSELSLLKQTPNVLRARGFRLYTEDGKRFIDLWLNGGAAVLGHTPPNLLRELKNAASRGLYAPYPHFTEGRFLKALFKLFPGFCFRFYAAPPAELTALFASGAAKLWRPYVNADDASLFVPVLPGVQTWRDGLPFGLCIAAVQTKTESLLSQLPANDALSPILLAAATRGIYDILAAPQRAKPNLPRINKIIKTNNSKWQRQGIYLTLKEKPAPQEWDTLFNQFMEAGFLLPPTPSFPLILPAEMSDGEEAKLANVLCQ